MLRVALPADLPDLLSVRQVCELIGRSPDTLYGWRTRKIGPKAIRIRGMLAYPKADLEAWLNQEAAEQDTVGT